jgi:hypothetical protein
LSIGCRGLAQQPVWGGATGCSRHDSLLLLLLLPRGRALRRRNLFSAAPCTDRRPRFLNVAVAVVAEMGCEMHAEGDSNARMRPREGARVRGSQGARVRPSTGTTAAWGMWGVQATLAAAGSNTVRPLHASWVGTAGSSTPTTHRPAAQLFLLTPTQLVWLAGKLASPASWTRTPLF